MSEVEPPEQRPSGQDERPLRDELASMARARVVFAASILLDTLYLVVTTVILAIFEWVRGHVHLHGINEVFVVATEVLLAGGTFAVVAFYVFLDVRVAYRRFRDAGQGDRHE